MHLKMTAAAAIAALMMAGGAHAATVPNAQIIDGDGSGNDCKGDFGTSPLCVLKIDNGDGTVFSTPQILKIDFTYPSEVDHSGDGNDVEIVTDVNTTAFPSVDGSEFSFDATDAGFRQFTYTLGAGDPILTHFSVKKGNGYTVYNGDVAQNDGYFTFDSATNAFTGFFTEDEPSHIVLFDSANVATIPLPAAGWLLLAGIGGLAAFRRRKSV